MKGLFQDKLRSCFVLAGSPEKAQWGPLVIIAIHRCVRFYDLPFEGFVLLLLIFFCLSTVFIGNLTLGSRHIRI